ncbi:MAG TPA: lipid-binding SYLF domain-containing protein [Usitatibacter sp.]|nr:lipid-binding SYLF domain-containing protein [Usitatibacter sp.]
MRKLLPLSVTAIAFLAGATNVLANDVRYPTAADTSNSVRSEYSGAHNQIQRAAATLRQMTEQAPGIESRLRDARAVFIMPRYGRGGLVIGGGGGQGILMVKGAKGWTGPALYKVGSVNIGAQAGGEGGAIVMILGTDRAVQALEKRNSFSLDANAGLSIVNWSKAVETRTNAPDIVMWTNLKGLYAGAAVGVTDAKFDARETSRLYGKTVSAEDVLEGSVHTALADDLVSALPA